MKQIIVSLSFIIMGYLWNGNTANVFYNDRYDIIIKLSSFPSHSSMPTVTIINNEKISERRKRKKHVDNAKRSSNPDECIASYASRIDSHCRYPGTQSPCYKQTKAKLGENIAQTEIYVVNRLARQCCEDGRQCTTRRFETACCRTPACLNRCYGSDFLEAESKLNEAQDSNGGKTSENGFVDGQTDGTQHKSRRVGGRFRFLSILTRSNPNRRLHHRMRDFDTARSTVNEMIHKNKVGEYDI